MTKYELEQSLTWQQASTTLSSFSTLLIRSNLKLLQFDDNLNLFYVFLQNSQLMKVFDSI